MARVREDRAVLHPLEVLAAQDVAVARHGDEHVATLGGVQRGHHIEALHPRLERAHRVDLAHDHRRAGAAGAQRDPAPGRAVPEHHDGLAREQQVRRAQDAVERRLPGPETVVEGALGGGLVDRQDRELQPPGALDRAQPDQTRRRLLRAADDAVGIEQRDGKVGAVVERHLRLGLQHGAELRLALPALGVCPDRLDDVGLHRQRIRRAEGHRRAARLERLDQHRGLGGHVQARADAKVRQRSLGGEPLADRAQDRHPAPGPFDSGASTGNDRA